MRRPAICCKLAGLGVGLGFGFEIEARVFVGWRIFQAFAGLVEPFRHPVGGFLHGVARFCQQPGEDFGVVEFLFGQRIGLFAKALLGLAQTDQAGAQFAGPLLLLKHPPIQTGPIRLSSVPGVL